MNKLIIVSIGLLFMLSFPVNYTGVGEKNGQTFEPYAWETNSLFLSPNAQGSFAEWTAVPDTNHFLNVDEYPSHDGDSTYLTSTEYARDEWEFPNPTGRSEPIEKVVVHITGRVSDTDYGVSYYMNGEYGMESVDSETYQEMTEDWYECPWTEETWTWDDIDDIDIRIQRSAATMTAYITQCYIEICYVTSSLSTVTLRPDGDDTIWWENAVPDNAHYLNVDDETPDDDTTYIYSDFGYDRFTLEDSTGQTGNIFSITAHARLKDGGGASEVTFFGKDVDPSTSWETYSCSRRQSLGTNYTWSDVDDMKLTLQRSSGTIYATQCYIEITYYDETIPSEVYVDDDYTSGTSGWEDTHFDNIPDANSRVLDGGTIYVHEGTYSDSVNIEKNLDIMATDAIMEGSINIDQGDLTVNISGFTFQNTGKIFSTAWNSYIKIFDNEFNNCNEAINLTGTDDTEIYNNTFDNNTKGLTLDYYCYDTNVYNNNFTSNNYGIWYADYYDSFPGDYHGDSYDGTFVHNNFINNTIQIYDCSTPVTNIYSQNYYSDYTGVDADLDGIGDTSYNITGGNHQDSSPLINPWAGSLPAPAETVTNMNTSETYTTIQNAIDNATSGDWILIGNRTYYENVEITKSLKLVGENYLTTIIDGLGGYALDLRVEDIEIEKLTIANGGMYLDESDNSYFTRNLFKNGDIDFHLTDNCTFFENNFTEESIIQISDTSAYNKFYWNNFYANSTANDDPPSGTSNNYYNDTYPMGGNYWEDHWNNTDEYSGPDQDIEGSDGITDHSYNAGRAATDEYPLVEPIVFGVSPPRFSDVYPSNGELDLSINTGTVSIRIEDDETFNWTIEGEHISNTGDTGDSSGVKIAALLRPLPYYQKVIFYVNATDTNNQTTRGIYYFKTEIYDDDGAEDGVGTTFVDDDFDETTVNWRKDRFSSIQDAVDVAENNGTIYLKSGTYYENLFIDKPVNIIGEKRSNTIIIGEPHDMGVVDSTMYIATDDYPTSPSGTIDGVVLSALTIRNSYQAPYMSGCVDARYVNNLDITDCNIYGGWSGVSLVHTSGQVRYSRIHDLQHSGILTTHCNNTFIFANDIFSTQIAANIQNTRNLTLRYNSIVKNDEGAYLLGADDSIIYENDFRENEGYGVNIKNTCNNITVYHNNFVLNARTYPWGTPQANDEADDTTWYEEYPYGGNYWDDIDESVTTEFWEPYNEYPRDYYHGENQDKLGQDGIVDGNSPNPYDVGNGEDLYPLAYEWDLAQSSGVEFIWSPKYPQPQERVIFFENSGFKDIDVRRWNFGDGTIEVTEQTSIAHTFPQPGYYSVKLTTQDVFGEVETVVKKIYIGANPKIPEPKDPKYPDGFSVPEMYLTLGALDLPESKNKVSVMVIDSGLYKRTYAGINLAEIESLHGSVFANGNDENGHGTWCNYAVAYMLQTKLPNSKQYSYKVFDSSGGSTTQLFLEAFDEALRLKPDVVSMSVGIKDGTPNDLFSQKCEELRNAGIIVIVAAGNYGPSAGSITSPAVSDSVIGVAASDPQWYHPGTPGVREQGLANLGDDTICEWSGRGPVEGVYPKPDITAPGESIRGPWLGDDAVKSGTSMSTPLVAGATAVIIAENKDLIDLVNSVYFWDKSVVPDAYEEALKESCYDKGSKNSWGEGVPQFDEVSANFRAKLYTSLMIGIFVPIFFFVLITCLAILYWRRRWIFKDIASHAKWWK